MAISLGEKLRQARESRDISISEVAEQTRISSLYLEGIEADDYRSLPGGIFNKGFVKSYAKYVGVDEQEALLDYARLIASQDGDADQDPKVYRPEVLTDDRNNSSNLLTIIAAVILLGLISWGAYTIAKYYGDNSTKTTEASETVGSSDNQANSNSVNSPAISEDPIPAPAEIKVELKAISGETSVSYSIDGEKRSQLVTPEAPLAFDVKDELLLSYSKYQSANVQVTINGKLIGLPSEPENSSRQAIDLTITKGNVAQILQSGQIVFEPAPESNSNSGAQ